MSENLNPQQELERIRQRYDYDFVALALAESAEFQYVIKWKYAAGNLNDRYKRIVLQSGKGIAGMVFKTGKPVFIRSVSQYVTPDQLFNYPIIQWEKLTSLAAVALWNDDRVAGVLLGGYRQHRQAAEDMLMGLEESAHQVIGYLNRKERMET